MNFRGRTRHCWTRLWRKMTRRRFLKDAVVGSAASFVPFQQPLAYKMGLQLFTIRAPMSKDAAGTLKRIASLGYEEVETYGFDPQGMGYYGMPARTFAQLLRDNNLTTPSGHYGSPGRRRPCARPAAYL